MCQAILQWRSDDRFDLSVQYCRPPEHPRVFDLEHIGTAMTDRSEAMRRAEAKYVHHDCAKRFGCSLSVVEKEPAPPVKAEPTFFEIAIKQD